VKSAWARARINAKLNLWLAVRGRREDGYHDIETVFHGIDIADEMTLSDATKGRVEVAVRPDGIGGTPPAPDRNLAHRATRAYLEATGIQAGVRVDILKRIPMGAGLGGGSADAAGVLVLLRARFGAPSDVEMLEIAAGLGSDVPYFLNGGTAVGLGRGERIEAAHAPERLWFVLGLSDRGLSTADVYGRWDALSHGPGNPSSEALRTALRTGDPAAIGRRLHNDLEAAALDLRPELVDKKRRMVEAGALGACITGSGPTIFGIASSKRHARSVAARLANVFDGVVVTASSAVSVESLTL
jgi:4-diphosphocytidyl-2-C-methyl-D-erythritol kinase